MACRRLASLGLFVLTRAELYHERTVGRGWSDSQARRWLVDVLAHQLLEDTGDDVRKR